MFRFNFLMSVNGHNQDISLWAVGPTFLSPVPLLEARNHIMWKAVHADLLFH